MATHLYTALSPFQQTNTVIYRLMRASIQAGIFCTIFAMGDMISFRKTFFLETMLADLALYIVAMPRTHLCGMFSFPIGRVYTNVSVFRSYLSTKDETSYLLDTYGLFKQAGSVERYFGRTTNGFFLFPLLISRVLTLRRAASDLLQEQPLDRIRYHHYKQKKEPTMDQMIWSSTTPRAAN